MRVNNLHPYFEDNKRNVINYHYLFIFMVLIAKDRALPKRALPKKALCTEDDCVFRQGKTHTLGEPMAINEGAYGYQ